MGWKLDELYIYIYVAEKAARGAARSGPRGMGRSGCNDVGRRRRWWRWVPTGVSIPRCQARKPTPTPLSSNFVHPRAAVPAEPALSFSLSAHPVGSTTHHLRPLSYRLVFRAHLRSLRYPLSVRHSHPHPEQLSGYELTELRSLWSSFELCGLLTAKCL